MTPTKTLLELRRVSFGYGSQHLLKHLSISIQNGERVALVGPSGQGKSTILRLIAGLESPCEGSIVLDGREVSSRTQFLPPEQRHVGLVFQDLALFPHLTVFDNIAFGLKQRGKTAQERTRVDDLMQLFEIADLAGRRPEDLSGGQKQRVAIARSLAPDPMLLMLDEPFSSLDEALRLRLLERLRDVFNASSATVLFVTHTVREAQFLAHRVVDLSALQSVESALQV